MALTYRTSAAGGGTSGTGDRSATITPAVGDLLVVYAVMAGTTFAEAASCGDNNGGSYTLLEAALHNGSTSVLYVFVRTALVPNTTSTTVTPVLGSNTAGEVVIVAVSGANNAGLSMVRSHGMQQNQASGAAPAPALNQSALTGNLTITAVGNGTNPPGLTAPTGWTSRQNVGQNTPATGLQVATRDSGFTGTTVTWGSNSGSAFGSHVLELDDNIDGSLNTTIAAVTVAGTATSPIRGSTTATLAAVTTTATATSPIRGTLAVTLDPFTLVATGTAPARGTTAATLADVALSGTATSPVRGSTATTVPDVTLGGTGAVPVAGAAAATLDPVTLGGAGQVPDAGALASTLDPVTVAGVAAAPVAGTTSATLDPVSLAGAGEVDDPPIDGTLDVTLGDVAAAGTGTAPIAGGLSSTLADVAVTGTAVAPVEGVADAELEPVTTAGTGSVPVTGTASAQVDDVALAGAATSPVRGQTAAALDPVTAAAAGTVPVAGSLDATVGAVALAGAGGSQIISSGALDALLDPVTLAASGTAPARGQAAVAVDELGVDAAGAVPAAGALGEAIDGFDAAASGTAPVRGHLDATVEDIALAAVGSHPPVSGALAITLAAVTLGATGSTVYVPPLGARRSLLDTAIAAELLDTTPHAHVVDTTAPTLATTEPRNMILKQNDTDPPVTARLLVGGQIPASSLTGTVTFRLARADGTEVFTRPAVIANAATWDVRYDLQAGDTATRGLYRGTWTVTFPGGAVRTWPSSGGQAIKVD